MSSTPLSFLSDEELLAHVLSQKAFTDIELELAERLGDALAEIALLKNEMEPCGPQLCDECGAEL